MLQVQCHPTYPFGSACGEEGGMVKGEMDKGVVMTETPAHLTPGAQGIQGSEIWRFSVPLNRGCILTVAKICWVSLH